MNFYAQYLRRKIFTAPDFFKERINILIEKFHMPILIELPHLGSQE